MSIKVVGYDNTPFDQRHEEARGDRFIRQVLLLVLSGNYVAGGDALDLSNAGGSPSAPNTISQATLGRVVDIDIQVRGTGTVPSLGAAGGEYVIVAPNQDTPLLPADLALLKLKIFKNTAGSVAEYPAGAYGTDVLADVITLEVVYSRGQ
jgi:hypothetical protein